MDEGSFFDSRQGGTIIHAGPDDHLASYRLWGSFRGLSLREMELTAYLKLSVKVKLMN